MGLFSRILGTKKKKAASNGIVYAQQDKRMQQASKEAQKNFKYFWRELYWEYRRIVPAHDFAMIKIPFEQEVADQDTLVEHMWINNISFNGETITGELVNEPQQLTNIKQGDRVERSISQIDDWMLSIQGEVYGGFTIQAMRVGMSGKERRKHDQAWGLDFGDPNEILVVSRQKEQPENLIEHPMSKNMAGKVRDFLMENPEEIKTIDGDGLSMLHREAIAGNRTNIEILLD